jgi:hypothetical protein
MTKSTESEIAVLQNQMVDVKASLEVIKAEQHTNFQALAAKIDNLANTPNEIEVINGRLTKLEKALARTWVSNTLSAAVGAIFVSLVIYAVTK